jgi:hypothetical protein
MSALELRRVGDIRLRIWRDISPELDELLKQKREEMNLTKKKYEKISLFDASEALAKELKKLKNNGHSV